MGTILGKKTGAFWGEGRDAFESRLHWKSVGLGTDFES